MISREQLAKEYISVIDNYYPLAGRLLRDCLVKILSLNADRPKKYFYYLGIYYPDRIGDRVLEQQEVFRDPAENMGLVEVIFLNANQLVRNPHSKIKEQDFRFWLDLCWLANEAD